MVLRPPRAARAGGRLGGLVAAVLGVVLGLLQHLAGGLGLTGQRPQQRPAQVALAVEQLRQVQRLQVVLGTGQQAPGLVGGEQQHGQWQVPQPFADGLRPGGRVAAVGVLLDHQEVGGGLGGHQADVLAVEVLVGDQGDVARRQAPGQQRALLVGEPAEVLLDDLAELVEGTQGGGDEPIQLGQPQELLEQAQAAGPAEGEDDEQRHHQPPQPGQAGCGAEEGDQVRVEVGVVGVGPQPGAEGGAGDAVFAGVLPLRAVVGVLEGVDGLSGEEVRPAGRVWAGVRPVGRLTGSHGSGSSVVVVNSP